MGTPVSPVSILKIGLCGLHQSKEQLVHQHTWCMMCQEAGSFSHSLTMRFYDETGLIHINGDHKSSYTKFETSEV